MFFVDDPGPYLPNWSKKQVCIQGIIFFQIIPQPKLILHRSMVTYMLMCGNSLFSTASFSPADGGMKKKKKKISGYNVAEPVRIFLSTLSVTRARKTCCLVLGTYSTPCTHTNIMMLWNCTGITFFQDFTAEQKCCLATSLNVEQGWHPVAKQIHLRKTPPILHFGEFYL